MRKNQTATVARMLNDSIQGGLKPEQRERYIKDIELQEQGDELFNVARNKSFAGRMSLESFDLMVERQHALTITNKINAANKR